MAGGALAANGGRGTVTGLSGGTAFLAFTHIQGAGTITTTYSLSTTAISYAYDPLYRLTQATYSTGAVYTYTYDTVGNRLADGAPAGVTLYAYDNGNRTITSTLGSSTFNYVWDNNGNLLGNNGAPGTYFYDAANRLTSLVNTGVITNFTYDGLGDRVHLSQTVPIIYTLDQAAGLTQVLAETNGALTTTYTYGQDRLSQQTITSTDYFLGDALGSVRELANATGNVTLVKSYDPYGQTISSSGTDSSNFDFTGEYKDPSALFYLRARYYTSRRGRFIQKDTWANNLNPQTLDAWVYVLGNPINYTDPSGHDGVGPGGDLEVPLPDCPSWWCNTTWSSYWVPDGYAAHQEIAGDTVACLVLGCHVDYDQSSGTLTISGPTSQQWEQSQLASATMVGADVSIGSLEGALSAADQSGGQLILPGLENYISKPSSAQSAADNFVVGGQCVAGEFSIIDWTGYPIEANAPRPTGPFQLLEGEEYDAARAAANNANRALHRANPSWDSLEIHEIQPVKFGGSPTSMSNKIPLSPPVHDLYTEWWYQLGRRLLGLR